MSNPLDAQPHAEPIGLGDVVSRSVGARQIRPCLVTGWYPAKSDHLEGHYVVTPIPDGMTKKDFGVKFWAGFVDEIPPRMIGVHLCPRCGDSVPPEDPHA